MAALDSIFSKSAKPLLLDGGLASTLESYGVNLNSSLWSASVLQSRPSLIQDAHLEFLLAGADIITTASYQATQAGFRNAGVESAEEIDQLIALSVKLAKRARDEFAQKSNGTGKRIWIAGSVGPYGAYCADGSEYTGLYKLKPEEFKNFHRERMRVLVEQGVDVLAIETFPSFAEAQAVLELLSEFPNTKAWFSFTPSYQDPSRIADLTPMKDVANLLSDSKQVLAIGVNCLHPDLVSGSLDALRAFTNKPLIVYPNSGEKYDAMTKEWTGEGLKGDELVARVTEWKEKGARIIGGCCQVLPETCTAMRNAL
jgi:homocysteine S-methyltransferase